jgi:hypothetical protein
MKPGAFHLDVAKLTEIVSHFKEWKLRDSDIGKLIGVSPRLISQIRRRKLYTFFTRDHIFSDKNPVRRNLTEEQVRKIWKLYWDGWTISKISRELNINRWNARDVLSGRCYRNVN